MKIKELKQYRREIEILIRENPDKMKYKIKELLNRVLEENGQDAYENEVEITFDNLLCYYVHKGERMPVQCYDLAIQFAEMLIEKENLQRAEEVVLSAANIVKEKNVTKKEVIQTDTDNEEFIKLREEILKIYELINRDKSKRSIDSYSLFVQMAKRHNLDTIKGKIFEYSGTIDTTPNPNPPDGPNKRSPLPHYLMPEHRLEFIEKSFPGRELKIFSGIAKFKDYLIIEIEGMDSVIVEKFFEETKAKGVKIAEGTDATYIVPKEFVIDLQKLSKQELNEFREVYPRIKKLNHKSGTIGPVSKYASNIPFDSINYYRKFKTRFNGSVEKEYFEGFGLDNLPKVNNRKSTTQKHKRNINGKTKVEDLADSVNEIMEEQIENSVEEPTQVLTPEENKVMTAPKTRKEELQEILTIKFQMVQQLTEELKEATANNQEITEICKNLRQVVQELENIQKQIRELGED